ncbi:MAG: crossover junction endodeoxyribonuclease RuvC [Planctomycetes bacterium]|nr:crossover junction endodeoxyribonuclease RuvC [Planctomycetota bacterium]MBI3835534.1 crossover junction endodeoxyribonuclease RuvC [Planctomycetota bacterium]
MDGETVDSIICGIDPGLGITGYAIIRTNQSTNNSQDFNRDPNVVDAGVCRFESSHSLPRRLAALHSDITAILEEHQPQVVAVEQLYSHYNHPRTAILMGHARGVILQAAASSGIEVKNYSATRIKRFLTGNGRASKGQMQRAVQVMLSLPAPPDPPDVADAIAVALCAAADVGASPLAKGGRRGVVNRSSLFAFRHSRPTGAL